MKARPFQQVDVFSATPYLGNPLAVVLDGSDLTREEMQHFAHWTHLSETAFVLPPTEAGAAAGADYQLRIFTPGAELPFAGHPTLGSCHAWLEAGGVPKHSGCIVQECGVGLVRIRHRGTQLAFAAPTLVRSAPTPALLTQVGAALGLERGQVRAAQILDNGPVWLALLLDSRSTVMALKPDHLALKSLGQKVGVVAIEQSQAGPLLIARSNREARAFSARSAQSIGAAVAVPEIEVRAFASAIGVDEDPVTGSLNASLAQWLMAEGLAPTRYTAAQGSVLGRAGRVHVEQDASGQVWVGGAVVRCIQGVVNL